MKSETTQVSAQYINRSFVQKLEQGRTKEAEAEGSAFIRDHVRQESYARELITPVLLQDDEIDRDENTDEPKKIVEKEPNSVATFVQFQGAGARTWFKGPRYSIFFGKTESQRFTKSKFQLMTYQNDIRKMLADNSVKDMADQEDKKFQETIDALIALNATEQSSDEAAFTSVPFKKAFQKMVSRRRPIGKMTMCKGLYYEALDLPATSVGDNIASRHYDDGIEQEEKLWGIPVVTTIKENIHDAKSVYVYAPENFLGNFYLLQDATLYIKQEADIISFWTYAAPGIGIGNRLSVQRIKFTF
jgi:hypothetical protein